MASRSARGSMDEEAHLLPDRAGALSEERSAGVTSTSGSTHGQYEPLPSSWPKVRDRCMLMHLHCSPHCVRRPCSGRSVWQLTLCMLPFQCPWCCLAVDGNTTCSVLVVQGQGRAQQLPVPLRPPFPVPWGVPAPVASALSNAVAVPGLLLGTLFEAGELPGLSAFTPPAAASGANSAALARSSKPLLRCCAACLFPCLMALKGPCCEPLLCRARCAREVQAIL